MIQAIRACKTAAEERAVRKECASICVAVSDIDNDYRHRNLAKCMFIRMLGYPTHFGQMECRKLVGFPEKRIGYLGFMLLLDERQEVLMLVTNSLKQVYFKNVTFKRSKVDSPIVVAATQNAKPLPHLGECQPIKCNIDRCDSVHGPEPVAISAPENVTKSCDGESTKVNKTCDWESLASTYRPQYYNQALRDLFESKK